MIISRTTEIRRAPPLDAEREALQTLTSAIHSVGVEVERTAIISLYVGLKSKPLTLVVGPENTGKVGVLRCLAQALTGGDVLRCQFMPGHAWWAGHSGNVALYTAAQTRLNTCKLLDLLEAAHSPDNRERVLLACLTRISPAELLTFFSDTAFQLQHGELMRLPAAHFNEPVPYPPNLLLAGTLDSASAGALDPVLLSMTNVVTWPVAQAPVAEVQFRTGAGELFGREFLASMIRTETAAKLKLNRVLHQSLAALWPLARLEDALQQHVPEALTAIRSELLIHLANAFSWTGSGLYAAQPQANLEIALDWAVSAIVLPRVQAMLPYKNSLRAGLQRVCAGRWPHAALAIEAFQA